MKLKHLHEALSLIEWNGQKYESSGLPFYQLPFSKQVRIKCWAKWILKVVEKAKEIENDRTTL